MHTLPDMLGLGLQATLTNEGGGIAKKQPVKDGLVMYHQYQDFPTDSLRLSFPSEGSAEFNGTSDYIQLNDPFSLTQHTIAAWVYANDTGAQKFIFDNRDADNDGIRLTSPSNETILYSVNVADVSSSTSYVNEWVYAVGTYDGTTQKLYVNGSLVSSQATSQTISTTTNAIIGRISYLNGEPMDGNLANVAIWNRALTSDEINTAMWASYDQLPTSIKVGLQAWYALDSQPVSAALYTEYVESQGGTVQDEAYVQQQLNALSV